MSFFSLTREAEVDDVVLRLVERVEEDGGTGTHLGRDGGLH